MSPGHSARLSSRRRPRTMLLRLSSAAVGMLLATSVPRAVGMLTSPALRARSSGSRGVTVSTFNLLCPAYRRMPGERDDVRESQFPQSYRARNEAILQARPRVGFVARLFSAFGCHTCVWPHSRL